MVTAAIQSSRLCSPIYDWHTTHLWTGQRCHRRSLSRRVRHCPTILRRNGRISGQRRPSPNIPGVNHRPAARKTTNSRHHCLHLLRYVCWEISAVRPISPMTPSVPVRPQSVTPKHQRKGEDSRTAFCVAGRAEGLPHLGTGLPVLPALQNLLPHSHSIGPLYAASSPFPPRPRKPRLGLFQRLHLNWNFFIFVCPTFSVLLIFLVGYLPSLSRFSVMGDSPVDCKLLFI
jgi:hypothetical protein